MCGFAIFQHSGSPSKQDLVENNELGDRYLFVRGPDQQRQELVKTQAGQSHLLHYRLAIIDVDSRSSQPMTYGDTPWVLLFNGEIYNYKELRSELVSRAGAVFQTQSDTEVVLRGFCLEGSAFFGKLRGMYAIALVHKLTGATVFARDHVGMKPLFFSDQPELRVASSDPRLIAKKIGATLNKESVAEFLDIGFISGTDSIFEKIEQVAPGCYVHFDQAGERTDGSIFDLALQFMQVSSSETEEKLACERALKSSVLEHLRADVDIGLMASGGIDTRLCTLGASFVDGARLVRAYTIDKPSGQWEYTASAQLLSKFKIQPKRISHSSFALEEFTAALGLCTQPVADMSILFTAKIAAAAQADNCKVLLSGVGGDEIFFGYNRYRSKCRKLAFSNASLLRRFKTGSYSQKLNRILSPSYGLATSILGGFDYSAVGLSNVFSSKTLKKYQCIDSKVSQINSPLQRMLAVDLLTYVPSQLCVISDSVLMGYSVEGRLPLLGQQLIRFSGGASDSFLNAGGVLKAGAKSVLDQHGFLTGYKGKSGFGVDDFREKQPWWREKMQAFIVSKGEQHLPINPKKIWDLSSIETFKLFCLVAWLEQL